MHRRITYCIVQSPLCGSLYHLWGFELVMVTSNKVSIHAFSVARPTVWNSLPDCLRDPAVDSEQFRRDLKTYLSAGHSRQ